MRNDTMNKIYQEFVNYYKLNGYSPSYRELAERLDSNIATISNYVNDLIELGFLEKPRPNIIIPTNRGE